MKIAFLTVTAMYLAIVSGGLFSELRAESGERATLSVLADNLPGAGDLAAPPTGQTLYVIDAEQQAVVAIDPFDPNKRWTAIASAQRKEPFSSPDEAFAAGKNRATLIAVACIDSSTLVAVCQAGTLWSLQSYRLNPPGVTADLSVPLQSVSLGTADGSAAAVRLAVSHSRNWLVVTGLPAPLAAVIRVPIAGVRMGATTTRNVPALEALRPTAVAVSPFDELVLFATRLKEPSDRAIFVSYYSPLSPQQLLSIDTRLKTIHDAAFCRADGTLWVVAGEPGSETSPEGLWRLDATLENSRQAIQATCIVRLAAPRSLVCLSDRAIIVMHGDARRTIVRVDPSKP